MKDYVITSESVTQGHPDKICDQISDAILDEYLKFDKNARVAVETMISNKLLVIAGEVSSKIKIDVEEIAKEVLEDIGYNTIDIGFDFNKSIVISNIVEQSHDISIGVNKEKICSGDQGIVYGYACNETKNYMPYSIDLANRLVKRLDYVRKNYIIEGLNPDGKSQVSIHYRDENIISIDSIVIAAQHKINVSNIKNKIIEEVIMKEIDNRYLNHETKIYVNNTGKFVKGGPAADCGLTGRKIIVDTYGSVCKHGGGAFSGKDPSKADRSGAYMARYIAKNIVASRIADRCEVGLSFVIGKEKVDSIYLNCFGSEKVSIEKINSMIPLVFNLSINSIINNFNMRRPIYRDLSTYGHFGRSEKEYLWERLDKIEIIRKILSY
ncbi:methionine adenosyltransferase [Anaerococcus sp. AGMB09787]|uniref:methionine adenosyltransferase n=1 Tax=Anaerococcus sp. AGMB09787 TaxID=2922869 RepID=UPI001FB00BE5|nr:methionine adenosyltransferase [Anaerococcus sp. AGMB09787]